MLTQSPKGIDGAFTRMIVENGFNYQLLYYTKPTSWTILRNNQISKVIANEDQSNQKREDSKIVKDFISDNNATNNTVMYWDFERAESLKLQITLVNIHGIPDYCRFLADTGKLDTLNNYLTELFSREGVFLREISALPDYKTLSHLNNIKEKYNQKQLSPEDLFTNLYKLGMSNQISELISILKNNWKKNILPGISAEENMILNFAFNKIIEHYKLDANLAASLIDHLFVVKHMSDTRKAYLLNKILSYFNEIEIAARNFFILKDQYYNHLQKLMSMLHNFSREMIGAKLALENLYILIRKYNDLSLTNSVNHSPKVAICISGMCRNDLSGLESIYKHLTNPLKADVFMHTWDMQQEWIGGSRANDRFWFRTFNVNEASVPTKLKNLEFLKVQYPNIYDSLMTVSFTKLDGENLENKFSFKRFTIENQEGFLSNYNIDEKYKSRGSLNQIKMFYGMWKVFDTLKGYEEENNFKYDYIIRVRPDLIIKNGVSVESLSLLSHDEIGVPTSFYGIQDMVFYAPRFSYEQTIDIFKPMLENKKLSPFINFPKYDAHALVFAWLLKHNIKPALCDIKYNVEEGVRNLKVPNLRGALDIDLNDNNKLKYPEETKWLEKLLISKAQ